MPIDPANVVSAAGDKVVNLKIVQSVGKNPVFLSLVIVIIVMLITSIVFRDVRGESSVGVLTLRAGFWSFLAITAAIFVNNTIMLQETTELKKSGAYNDIFDYSAPIEPMRGSAQRLPDNVIEDDIPRINMSGL
jgi:hypothetical protein